MAKEQFLGGGGGRFWLPPELLAGAGNGEGEGDDDFFLLGGEADGVGMPRGPSPNDSSDEEGGDDYLAGLTKEMAHFFLLDDDDNAAAAAGRQDAKPRDVSGTSPQSTLCAMGYLYASGRESPAPAAPSEPPPAGGKEEDTWSLLFEAADHVMRMRLQEQQASRELPIPARKQKQQQHNHISRPAPPPSAAAAATAKGHFADQAAVALRRQLQVAQFHALRQQQLLKQQQMAALWAKQNRARAAGPGAGAGGGGRPVGPSPAAWPPLQKPQPGAGMRAMFLTGGAKKESAGTGVFLPRRPGAPADPRRKPACSTVLLPARVVQALNLNLDDLGTSPRYPGGFVLDHDSLVGRSNALAATPAKHGSGVGANRHQHLRSQPPPVTAAQELRLPQEWTY